MLCGVKIALPDQINTFSKEALTMYGDPDYIIFWDDYNEAVEGEAWSGWFWVDVVLFVVPVEKVFAIAGKAAVKSAPKLAKLFMGGEAKELAKAVATLAKSVGKVKDATKSLMGRAYKFVIAAGEKDAPSSIKGWKMIMESLDEAEGVLSKEAIEQGKIDAKIFAEEYEKGVDALIEQNKKIEGKAVEIAVRSGSNEVAAEVIDAVGKGLDPAKKNTLKFLIMRSGICAPAGILASDIKTELIKTGVIKEECTKVDGEEVCSYKLYGDLPVEKDMLFVGLWVVKGSKIYARVLQTVYDKKSGKYVTKFVERLYAELADEPEKTIIYDITKEKPAPIGTVKEILANPRLRVKASVNCLFSAAFAFAYVDAIKALEAKDYHYATYPKCYRKLCLKAGREPFYNETPEIDEIKDVKLVTMRDGVVVWSDVIPTVEVSIPCPVCDGGKIRFTPISNPFEHKLYLASPCFAFAQLWVASCSNPYEKCKDESCEKCVWVALEKGYGMKYQGETSFNYCAYSPVARLQSTVLTSPWPHAGYWTTACDDPVMMANPFVSGLCQLCKNVKMSDIEEEIENAVKEGRVPSLEKVICAPLVV